MVLEVPSTAPLGDVVVVVEEVFDWFWVLDDDWLLSSWASFASSALTVDCAEETDSLSAVVSRVPSVCPAVTCWPTAAVTVATWPATWNEAEASLTGSTVPTTVMVCPMFVRVTEAVRKPEFPPPVSAHAAAPPPRTMTKTTAPATRARR